VPARKKQPADGEAPVTPRRKKAAPADKGDTAVTRQRRPAANGTEGGNGADKPDLVIVESPTKAKTINKYLGPNFVVRASYGHVRDLPRKGRKGEVIAGVNIDGWIPTYVVQTKEETHGKGKAKGHRKTPREILGELKREAARCNRVFLATDPDREGEAIAWHIEEELGLDDARTFRITFNEITRSAVQHAIAHPGKIDIDRVRAQEARRIMDRAVGYPLSKLLGVKVARGLSAGRVQSVALRLVVDREREIEAFKSEEYWRINALLAPEGTAKVIKPTFTVVPAKKGPADAGKPDKPADKSDKPEREEKAEEKPATPCAPEGTFYAELATWQGKKFEAKDQAAAVAVATLLDAAAYKVAKIEQKDRAEKAPPPFITSTLQQQANIRLHFTGERTMRAAQKLYEGVDLGSEGSVALITYMRTDSTRVSSEALTAVRDHIDTHFGKAYLPEKPNFFASGKSAQEAHEAIRPTDLAYTPERVDRLLPASTHHRHDLIRLYTLIYNRFVASQMTPAVFAVTNVEVEATAAASRERQRPESPVADAPGSPLGVLKAQGKVLKFDGYRKVLPAHKAEDATLPVLKEQQKLDRLDLLASQHFTQPPPRYSEASLIKALEKEGIGRPSTYASIIGKITSDDRGYIQVKERRFYATRLGMLVTDLLVKHFEHEVDVKFTSSFEEKLDQIETRQTQYNQVLDEFWNDFSQALDKAQNEMPAQRGIPTGENCPECGRPLVKNFSRKTGNEFIGCSGWKEGCKYIKPREGEPPREAPVVTDIPCPTCGKMMLKRKGPRGEFLGCSGYPECQTKMNFDAEGKPVLAAKPTEHVCDKCGKPMVIRQGPRGPFLACTGFPKCRNAKDVDANGNPVKPIDSGIACEKCGSAMVVKRGPRGPFLGCSAYPKCRSTKPVPEEMKEKLKELMPAPPTKKPVPAVEVSETCPECGAPMKLLRNRRGGYFLGCSNFSKTKCKGTREAPLELLEQLAEAGVPS
jgi:DNA topoisomerase-1